MKKIQMTETVLRDANQSLMATRMPAEDFKEILETIDEAGYYSIECWGGATFDACLRYLNEDPWERLRLIRRHVKKTKLQMLLRGQNLLGYKNYPDDVVRRFTARAAEDGIDIIRVFDALNDPRNLETAVSEGVRKGVHVQGAVCYTLSPVHSSETYVKLGKQMREMGCSSLCIKDMAGIMTPAVGAELTRALKSETGLPVTVHTHSTTGLGPITLFESVRAGADGIDTAISSFSGGTSQPATESLDYALTDSGWKTGLDREKLKKINDFFRPLQTQAIEKGWITPYLMGTETDALVYQIPGGMLSNLVAQLAAQNASHRLAEVLEEVPRVRRDLGYPPLVTPASQMVGVQAVVNVLTGTRYQSISKEIAAYIAGEYGAAPGEIDPELSKRVLGGEKAKDRRPADDLPPAFDKAREKLGELGESEEDVLSYLAFPDLAMDFLKKRKTEKENCVSYRIERVDNR